MLMKTERSTPIGAVEINVREDVGIADVWLHKNIEESTRTNDQGEASAIYTADEVYFMHAYTDRLEGELTASFVEWWEYGKTWMQERQLTNTEKQLKAANERIEMLEECLLEMSAAVYA